MCQNHLVETLTTQRRRIKKSARYVDAYGIEMVDARMQCEHFQHASLERFATIDDDIRIVMAKYGLSSRRRRTNVSDVKRTNENGLREHHQNRPTHSVVETFAFYRRIRSTISGVGSCGVETHHARHRSFRETRGLRFVVDTSSDQRVRSNRESITHKNAHVRWVRFD